MAKKDLRIDAYIRKAALLKNELASSGQPLLKQVVRITSVSDLPKDRDLVRLVRAAARLNDAGVKVARVKPAPKAAVKVPASLSAALAKHPAAKQAFGAFSPSHRREYVEWVTAAKTDATRARRTTQAIAMIAEGKSRDAKYQR